VACGVNRHVFTKPAGNKPRTIHQQS
jgi:hypothetical protein